MADSVPMEWRFPQAVC